MYKMSKTVFLLLSYLTQFILAIAMVASIYYELFHLTIVMLVCIFIVRFITKKTETDE